MNAYICPVCGGPLLRDGRVYKCSLRHSFDVSASGYVNLTPPSAGSHGDDAEMVTARRTFLNAGHYEPLADAVCAAMGRSVPDVLLDAGCGEGYYTNRMCRAFPQAAVYGIDISKKAAEKAAKLCKSASFCVASVYRMPYADGVFDCAVNIFSPLADDEYRRVIKPGGRLIIAVPGPDHLIELKNAVYDNVNVKEEKDAVISGFRLDKAEKLRFVMDLDGEEVRMLFAMTPYSHKTSFEDRHKLDNIEEMKVTASFSVLEYTRI